MDVLQAATAAIGPVVLGFCNTPEASTFYAQALSELGVIGLTDWDAATSVRVNA
jgi:hypothetical protein